MVTYMGLYDYMQVQIAEAASCSTTETFQQELNLVLASFRQAIQTDLFKTTCTDNMI